MAGIKPSVEINGYVVRHLRIAAGRSVKDIADAVDVERPYIAKIELGHSKRVSPKVFNALLATFSIDDRRVLMANPHGTAALEESA